MTGHDLTLAVDLPASRDTVWAHLTEAQLVLAWWPDQDARTDPREGGSYRLSWSQGVTLRGDYLVVTPPERLDWTWAWDHEDETPRRVSMTLEDRDGATVLTLEHEAHDDEERRSYEEGWTHFLGRLSDLLAPD